jgi:hypothetical protein
MAVPRRLPVGLGGLAVLALVTAGCGDEPARGQDAFCRQLQLDRAAIDTPAGSPAAADAQLARFRALDRLAPEAIRDEWHLVTELVAASTSTDVASAQGRAALVEAALAAARPAATVRSYVRDVCGVELTGTVVITPTTDPTVAPPAESSAPATTGA